MTIFAVTTKDGRQFFVTNHALAYRAAAVLEAVTGSKVGIEAHATFESIKGLLKAIGDMEWPMALDMQRDPTSIATIFTVTSPNGTATCIDAETGEEYPSDLGQPGGSNGDTPLRSVTRAGVDPDDRGDWEHERRKARALDRRLEEEQDPPDPRDTCDHDWNYTGTQYGGDDDRWHGEGRVICRKCGQDGDA